MAKPSAFISHVHEDSDIATQLEGTLREALLGGVSFFNSSNRQSIRPGDPWRDLVIAKLRDAVAVLVIATPESVGRPWVNFEAGGAWVHGGTVIPCCARGMAVDSLPAPLSHLHAVSLEKGEDLRDLVAELAGYADLETPERFDYSAAAERLGKAGMKDLSTGVDPAFADWLRRALVQPARLRGTSKQALARVKYISAVDQETIDYGFPRDFRDRVQPGRSIRFSAEPLDTSLGNLYDCFAAGAVADELVDRGPERVYRMTFLCMGALREMADPQPMDRDSVWEDKPAFFVDVAELVE